MDDHVAALKRGSRRNGVVWDATRVVNNERELFAAGSILAAVSYCRGESEVASREEYKAIARTIDLNARFAL